MSFLGPVGKSKAVRVNNGCGSHRRFGLRRVRAGIRGQERGGTAEVANDIGSRYPPPLLIGPPGGGYQRSARRGVSPPLRFAWLLALTQPPLALIQPVYSCWQCVGGRLPTHSAMATGFGSNPASIIGFQLLAMCRGTASCSFGNGNWFSIGLQLLTVCRGTTSYSFGNGNWFWL